MLHNIYPTMAHLKRWKIKDSENCTNCDEKETFQHAIFDCPIAKGAFEHFENEILFRYDNNFLRVKLTLEDIIVGLKSTGSLRHLTKEQVTSIDTVLILLKQKLILQRENKQILTRRDITMLFEERKRLDKYNNLKYKKGKNNIEMAWGRASTYLTI